MAGEQNDGDNQLLVVDYLNRRDGLSASDTSLFAAGVLFGLAAVAYPETALGTLFAHVAYIPVAAFTGVTSEPQVVPWAQASGLSFALLVMLVAVLADSAIRSGDMDYNEEAK